MTPRGRGRDPTVRRRSRTGRLGAAGTGGTGGEDRLAAWRPPASKDTPLPPRFLRNFSRQALSRRRARRRGAGRAAATWAAGGGLLKVLDRGDLTVHRRDPA